MKVLVIGDSCTDIFIYGDIERICPEAPVPVIKVTHKTKNRGMAENVVANLEALGCEVDIITNPNDIKKIRYVDNRSNQLVLRVDKHDYCDKIGSEELMIIKDKSKESVLAKMVRLKLRLNISNEISDDIKKEFDDLTEVMSKTESLSSSNLEDEDYLWLSENVLNKE